MRRQIYVLIAFPIFYPIWWIVFIYLICDCVGRINGDSVYIGYVVFGHDGAFILC